MTYLAVLHGDTAATVITVLNAALTPPVSGKVPNPRPDTFVTVRRTGGAQANRVVDAATIVVEAWALTDTAALDLAQLARRALHEAQGTVVGDTTVYRVQELSGPAELPDPLSEQPRTTQTFTVETRGT